MRILIVGNPDGLVETAVAIANRDGGRFLYAADARAAVRNPESHDADLLLIDAGFDLGVAMAELERCGIIIPAIAIGIGKQPKAAAAAIKAGARKYVPLPEKPQSIAATLLVLAERRRQMVGRTVAEVEKDLIIETLRHCMGNRTRAADILGISIRTLRNKLNQYSARGLRVPPPGDDKEIRLHGRG